MSRTIRTSVAAVTAIAALAAVGTASTAPAPKVVKGSVGPGFTINLKMDGKKVTKLKAGKPYRFVITDGARDHDFHLSGPGVDRVLTGVSYTGTKSFTLTLKKGKYTFVCDPHAGSMQGSFVVA